MDDRNLYGTAIGVKERGRHQTVESEFDAAVRDLTIEKEAMTD